MIKLWFHHRHVSNLKLSHPLLQEEKEEQTEINITWAYQKIRLIRANHHLKSEETGKYRESQLRSVYLKLKPLGP